MGEVLRRTIRTEMGTYLNKLQRAIESGQGFGDSITREFYIFEDDHFAIEHAISLSVFSNGGNWTGIYIINPFPFSI